MAQDAAHSVASNGRTPVAVKAVAVKAVAVKADAPSLTHLRPPRICWFRAAERFQPSLLFMWYTIYEGVFGCQGTSPGPSAGPGSTSGLGPGHQPRRL